jgi:hypothetical protein
MFLVFKRSLSSSQPKNLIFGMHLVFQIQAKGTGAGQSSKSLIIEITRGILSSPYIRPEITRAMLVY